MDYKWHDVDGGVAVLETRTLGENRVFDVVRYGEDFSYRTVERRSSLGSARLYAKRVREGQVSNPDCVTGYGTEKVADCACPSCLASLPPAYFAAID